MDTILKNEKSFLYLYYFIQFMDINTVLPYVMDHWKWEKLGGIADETAYVCMYVLQFAFKADVTYKKNESKQQIYKVVRLLFYLLSSTSLRKMQSSP